MDTSVSDSVGNHGSPLSFKTGDKIKRRIRDVVPPYTDAGSSVADGIDSVVGQATQGLEKVKGAIQHTRDSISESADVLVTYTKENPVKALMIAAVSGALLGTLFKSFTTSRD